jgi:Domain of unknown function (DUF4397)
MKRKSVLVALLGALLALVLAPTAFAADMAKVRVVHASPDAPAVDVWVNGAKTLTNVPFFTASDYLDLPAGSYDIQVVPTGATTPVVIDAKGVKVEAGKAYTIAAVGKLADIKANIYADNLAAPAAGKAHVRVIHASPDAPAVDVKVANGATLIPNLAFPKDSGYLPVDAGSYDLQVTPAGGTAVVLDLKGTKLEAGKIYDVFAVGELANIRVEVTAFTPAAAPTTLPSTSGEELPLGMIVAAAGLLVAGAVALRRRV